MVAGADRGGAAASGSPSATNRMVELLGSRVHIAPWILEQVGRLVGNVAPAHSYAIITDATVAALHLPVVVGSLHHFAPRARTVFRAVAPGEATKTRESWAALTDWMLHERCGRDTTVIALGGGVVGDLAGFVAATFMRGVPVVQLPTTLLAMVDASVGGKVGVDTPAGKNLVGAFHQPAAVLVDPTVLQTLPVEHRRAGMAEVLKHGFIADADYVAEALQTAAVIVAGGSDVDWHGDAVAHLVARSIQIKADVVRADEREGGVRQILNFGHTIGHAVEAASDFRILHGDAVAIGMALEARLAEQLGVAERGTADTVRDALQRVGLPTERPHEMSLEQLLALMQSDKKVRSGELRFAFPARVGAMAGAGSGYGIAVPRAAVADVLEARIS